MNIIQKIIHTIINMPEAMKYLACIVFMIYWFFRLRPKPLITALDIDAESIIGETFKMNFMSRDASEFKIIREAAAKLGLTVYPKVKTTELVSARTHLKSRAIVQRRLQYHCVDFVICNKRDYVVAVVLLYKNCQRSQTEMMCQSYAETALGAHGYKIIRAEGVHPDILDCLKDVEY